MSGTYKHTITGNDSVEFSPYDQNSICAYLRALTWSPEKPASGTVTIEFLNGYGEWRLFRGGFLDMAVASSQPTARITGEIIRSIRVTVAGVAPTDTLTVEFLTTKEPDATVDPRVYSGFQAFTTQPFTEANVKNGTQHYIRVAYPSANPIPAGETRKIYLTTGANQVLVKLREFEYVGEELQIELFTSPTGVTGGTQVGINNWNAINPQSTTSTCTRDVSTASDGTPLESEPEYFYGGQFAFNRDFNSIPIGRERVIPANSSFLVSITNNDTGGAARCSYFLDWYEGPISTEI